MIQQIKAEVILDSEPHDISGGSARLTTMVLTFPRIILPEALTHRDFSRGSASSRAIPSSKLIEQVSTDPFVPKVFTEKKPGMSSNTGIPFGAQEQARKAWLRAAAQAADATGLLNQLGVHKQHANRLLEPFLWTRWVISSTRWDNFFQQRIDPAAQPEMQELASAMKEALDASTPTKRMYHTPFVSLEEQHGHSMHEICMVSAGRCCLVSYDNLGKGKDWQADYERGVKLFHSKPRHYSPAEHVACSDEDKTQHTNNFDGGRHWTQLRNMWQFDLMDFDSWK